MVGCGPPPNPLGLTRLPSSFQELKAQLELHGQARSEAGAHLDSALRVIPVADEMARRAAHEAMDERWRAVLARASAVQDALAAELRADGVPAAGKLRLLERELAELNAALGDMHGVLKTQEELGLYAERLQVSRAVITAA